MSLSRTPYLLFLNKSNRILIEVLAHSTYNKAVFKGKDINKV